MQRPAHQLDTTDRAIIDVLQRDGRMAYTRLGQEVGLSEAAARQRVQRLIDAGVMQVVAITNPLSIGYRRMAMIGVRTEGPSEPIAEALQAMPELDYLVITAGSFDMLCEVIIPEDSDLLELINRIRRVPGVVSTESFIYLDLVKQTYTYGSH